MAVSLPSFAHIGQLAAQIKSPARALAEGIASGMSLADQRKRTKIAQQKQDLLNAEAAQQAKINTILSQQQYSDPYAQALASEKQGIAAKKQQEKVLQQQQAQQKISLKEREVVVKELKQAEGVYKEGEIKKLKLGDKEVAIKFTPDGAGDFGPDNNWKLMAVGSKERQFAAPAEIQRVGFGTTEFKNAAEAAGVAQEMKANLQGLTQLMAGLDTDSLTNIKQTAMKLANAFGITGFDASVAKIEAGGAVAGRLMMDVLAKFVGSTSEGEMHAAYDQIPQMTDTPKGRALLTKFLSQVSDRAMAKKQMLGEYLRDNEGKTYPKGKESWDTKWDTYISNTPIVLAEPKQGNDGNWYVPNPNKPGEFMRVDQ